MEVQGVPEVTRVSVEKESQDVSLELVREFLEYKAGLEKEMDRLSALGESAAKYNPAVQSDITGPPAAWKPKEPKSLKVPKEGWTAKEEQRGWRQVRPPRTKVVYHYKQSLDVEYRMAATIIGTVRCVACGNVQLDNTPGSSAYRVVDETGVQYEDWMLCGQCRSELAYKVDPDVPDVNFPSTGTREWWQVDVLTERELAIFAQDARINNGGFNNRRSRINKELRESGKIVGKKGNKASKAKNDPEEMKAKEEKKLAKYLQSQGCSSMEALIESRVAAELAKMLTG